MPRNRTPGLQHVEAFGHSLNGYYKVLSDVRRCPTFEQHPGGAGIPGPTGKYPVHRANRSGIMATQPLSPNSSPLLFACMLGVSGLLLSACSGTTAPQATVTVTAPLSAEPTSPEASTPAASTPAPSTGGTEESAAPDDAPEALSALVAAGKTALGEVPGDVTAIESHVTGRTWEVTVFSTDNVEHEMRVNAEGTQLVSGPTKERNSSVETRRYRSLIDSAKLDFAQAADAIIKEVPQAAIRELSLDSWRGTTTWESEVRDGSRMREVYVDAVTGKIIKNELD